MDKSEKEKDIQGGVMSNKDSLSLIDRQTITFFKNSPDFVFCYKKSVKLLKAIYVITESFNFSQNDREAIRTFSQKIVKDVIAICTEERQKDRYEATLSTVAGLERTMLSLFALLDALSSIGIVSSMNVAVCISEYQRVLEAVVKSTQQFKPESEMTIFTEDFFAVPKEDPSSNHHPSLRAQLEKEDKGHYRTKSSLLSYKPTPQGPLQTAQKDLKVASKGQAVVPTKIGRFDTTERTELILKEVRDKGSVTIKDVSILMKQVSEKTVQRELIALVGSGVLKKEGERRWSRYFLV